MKERPILFSAPMVRAILDGSKTQTRRIVKSKHIHFLENSVLNFLDGKWNQRPLPYGKPGDGLWVREKFQPLFADGVEHQGANWKTGKGYAVSYPATDGIKEFIDLDDNITSACKPSIHMPRWASRINLEITGVRVERLQDISEADAIAEGARKHFKSNRDNFCAIWQQINGAGSWEANPWVWVVEFKKIEGGAA